VIGQQIGEFRIIEKLGEGGMGVVYKAIDVRLDRPVAIKMLTANLADNPELVQRFQAEARAQANLNHTNLATLYAFLVDQGHAHMVMEFVEGENFDQIIRRNGPMSTRDAVPWFKQALLGIGAAHRMGIIHRDIKPSNLMLNRQGIVKVMDFGIAKAVGSRGMTRTGMHLGTLAYMSPEQVQNRTVDVRSDIYALGITLYEMLSGHVPFESESDFQTMQDHVNTPPPPLARYYAYAPRAFENVVAKALAKIPDDRFQTVEEFGVALEQAERVPVAAGSVYPGQVPEEARRTVIDSGTAASSGAIAQVSQTAPAAIATGPSGVVRTRQEAPRDLAGQKTAMSQDPTSEAPARKPVSRTLPMISVGAAALAAILLVVALWPRRPAAGPISSAVSPAVSSGSKMAIAGQTKPQESISDILDTQGGSNTLNPSATDPGVASGNTRAKSTDTIADNQLRHTYSQPSPNAPLAQPTAQQRPQSPAYQSSQAEQVGPRSFIVRHRHIVQKGAQTQVYYCAGPLLLAADGTITYSCAGTNDPSKRCEHVTFIPGSIRQIDLRGGSELHMATASMGDWDFYDYNAANTATNAYQAILPFIHP
jgi:serine/threonine protein kinase